MGDTLQGFVLLLIEKSLRSTDWFLNNTGISSGLFFYLSANLEIIFNTQNKLLSFLKNILNKFKISPPVPNLFAKHSLLLQKQGRSPTRRNGPNLP